MSQPGSTWRGVVNKVHMLFVNRTAEQLEMQTAQLFAARGMRAMRRVAAVARAERAVEGTTARICLSVSEIGLFQTDGSSGMYMCSVEGS